jgi:hypothetical protein
MQPICRRVLQTAAVGRAKWGLSDWGHLVALVAAQIAGVRSLRDLERLLAHHQRALSHLAVRAVHRSTLADANRTRPPTPISDARPRRIAKKATHILDDRVGRLPARLCGSRHNPFQAKVRVIRVEISTGRVIDLLTNDLKTAAVDIARLYKARWEVELFFKWIKQNLKIQHFFGASRNAVTLQVIAALIAFLLVRLAHLRTFSSLTLQEAFRIVGAMLMQRRALHEVLHPPQPPPAMPDPTLAQLTFHIA